MKMKKVIIVCVVLIAAVLTSNAQVFVGGGLGVDFNGGKYKGGSVSIDSPSKFSFNFTPKVGFYLNDNFAIGLEVGLSSTTTKTPKEIYGWSDDRKVSSFGWEVGAFARYNLLGTERLSLLLEGTLGVGGEKSKTKQGSTTQDGDSETMFGISVLPVLQYSLTDRLCLEMSCDFLRWGFLSSTVKDADDYGLKITTNSFGFGVNSGTLSVISILNLGLIFKF